MRKSLLFVIAFLLISIPIPFVSTSSFIIVTSIHPLPVPISKIENNYNKSELEMFRVFYEEYGEEKLLLGATKRLHDGYEAYRNIRDGED